MQYSYRTTTTTTTTKQDHDYSDEIEIGVDEAGRGPLFGRLYVAAVALPKTPLQLAAAMAAGFDPATIKDSKKYTSERKIRAVADMIKLHAVAWDVQFIEPQEIDEINIRQAVLKGMRSAIRQVVVATSTSTSSIHHTGEMMTMKYLALVDGNDFHEDPASRIRNLTFVTVPGGDNTFVSIAAASVLAKVARDDYIQALCAAQPELSLRYALDRNVGYGTKAHLEGIHTHGITIGHRRTFGCCKTAKYLHDDDLHHDGKEKEEEKI